MENFFDFEYFSSSELIEKGIEAMLKYKASENINDYTVDPKRLKVFENLIKFFMDHTEMNTFNVGTEVDPIIGCGYITVNIEDFYISSDDVRDFGLILSETSAFTIDCPDGRNAVIEITVPGVFIKKSNQQGRSK